jgi:hypothetical protein
MGTWLSRFSYQHDGEKHLTQAVQKCPDARRAYFEAPLVLPGME